MPLPYGEPSNGFVRCRRAEEIRQVDRRHRTHHGSSSSRQHLDTRLSEQYRSLVRKRFPPESSCSPERVPPSATTLSPRTECSISRLKTASPLTRIYVLTITCHHAKISGRESAASTSYPHPQKFQRCQRVRCDYPGLQGAGHNSREEA